jgi:hypothetical protein
VSRARRLPRHRRPTRIDRTAAPIAFGGALAAVALTASPLGDEPRRPAQPAGQTAGPDRGRPDVVLVEPASDDGDRAGGAAGPAPGDPTTGDPTTGGGAGDGTGSADRAAAPTVRAAVPSSTVAPNPSGTTAQPARTPTATPTSTGPPTPTMAPSSPATRLPLPLPTPSSSNLPTLPVPLPSRVPPP